MLTGIIIITFDTVPLKTIINSQLMLTWGLPFWYPINVRQGAAAGEAPFHRNVSIKGALCRWIRKKTEYCPRWMQYDAPTQELGFISNCILPGQPYNWGPSSSINKVSGYYCFTQAKYFPVRCELLFWVVHITTLE